MYKKLFHDLLSIENENSYKKRDVLIVDFVGTSPSYTAHFSDALQENKLLVDTLIPRDHSDLIFLSNLNVNYAYNRKYSAHQLKKIFNYLAHWVWIFKNSTKYESIHFQWFPLLSKSRLDLLLLKKLMKKNPSIFVTVHNILPHDNTSEKVKDNYQELYKIVPYLVVHTLKTKKDLIQHFNISDSKILRINHGPLFSYYSKLNTRSNSGKLRLGILGFLKPYKGIEQALELVKMTKGTENEFTLIIKGKGEPFYTSFLEKKIIELEIQSLVKINLGYLSLKDYINSHNELDGVLAPYREIDQSGAIISAISLGRPVLGFSIGGIAELIINKKNGYLVPPYETDRLIEGIKWLKLSDSKVLFEQCKKSLDLFSWQSSAELLHDYYIRNEQS